MTQNWLWLVLTYIDKKQGMASVNDNKMKTNFGTCRRVHIKIAEVVTIKLERERNYRVFKEADAHE